MAPTSRGWFQGQVAIVTGASRGIGRAVAERLASEGASLLLTAVDPTTLERVQRAAEELGATVEAVSGDLGDEDLPSRLVDVARQRLGRIDVIINNAFWEAPGSVADVSVDGWDRTLRVSLSAAMLLVKAALPTFIEQRQGSIVNVSSMRAVAAGHAMAAYESAKAAMFGLTRSIAIDFGRHGVRCNCVSPGLVLSERVRDWYESSEAHRLAMDAVVPLGRPGTPEEIANVIAFVAGPEASYMNGSIVWVDGGSVAGLPENAALELADRFATKKPPRAESPS